MCNSRVISHSPIALGILALVGFTQIAGCGGRSATRAEEPGVSIGLSELMSEPETVPLDDPTEHTDSEIESLIAQQAAALQAAYAADPEPSTPTPSTDDGPAVSLEDLIQGEGDSPAAAAQTTETPETVAENPASRVDELSAQLTQALGQELEATSEPFRTAVAMIALAAAQGRDPLGAIAPGSTAAARLSPSELKSAGVVAQLLGTLLSPGSVTERERAAVLGQFAAKLSQGLGLTLPKAVLCTRVRGFGKYEPFTKTDFLAGRRIRALVYVEVEGFEHRPMDTSRLGGLETEDQWSVELSEELELRHEGDGMLAWRRPAEKVVETSRNKQRDFYLLADIDLPTTLTVGAYQLKVIVRDEVSGSIAEKLIPIGVVADPNLAWHDR